MTRLLILALFLLAGHAQAATYYFSDCGTGADVACVAGSDANAGTVSTSPKQTCSAALTLINAATAGDQILFAKGGSWTSCGLRNIQSLTGNTNRRANPIIIGAYTPAWGPGTARPILKGDTASAAVIRFDGAAADEGYTVRDLEIRPHATNGRGIDIAGSASYITLSNLMLDATATASTSGLGLNFYDGYIASSAAASHHIFVTGSTIKGWKTSGVFAAANHLVFDGNTWDSNGNGTTEHHIYVGSPGDATHEWTSYGLTIRRNTLTNANYQGAGFCAGSIINIQGDHDGVQVTDNLIEETTNATNGSCLGIFVGSGYNLPLIEAFRNVTIARNRLKGVAWGIAIDECQDCAIEANAITMSDYAFSNPAISADATAVGSEDTGDLATQRIRIVNNSIYYPTPSTNSRAIALPEGGSGHVVANNLIYFAAGTTTSTSCFDAKSYTPTYTYFDRNLCYYAGTAGKWEVTAGSLASWRSTYSGRDTNSLTTDPVLTAAPSSPNWTITIQTTSPAKNAGSTTYFSRSDYARCVRSSVDATPDIGAHEYKATACTAAPLPPIWVQ